MKDVLVADYVVYQDVVGKLKLGQVGVFVLEAQVKYAWIWEILLEDILDLWPVTDWEVNFIKGLICCVK